jgi:hypothetical protein
MFFLAFANLRRSVPSRDSALPLPDIASLDYGMPLLLIASHNHALPLRVFAYPCIAFA